MTNRELFRKMQDEKISLQPTNRTEAHKLALMLREEGYAFEEVNTQDSDNFNYFGICYGIRNGKAFVGSEGCMRNKGHTVKAFAEYFGTTEPTIRTAVPPTLENLIKKMQDENISIHVKTEEEAKKVLKLMDKVGVHWRGGESLVHTHFNTYGDKTTYQVGHFEKDLGLTYANTDYDKTDAKGGIVEAEDFFAGEEGFTERVLFEGALSKDAFIDKYQRKGILFRSENDKKMFLTQMKNASLGGVLIHLFDNESADENYFIFNQEQGLRRGLLKNEPKSAHLIDPQGFLFYDPKDTIRVVTSVSKPVAIFTTTKPATAYTVPVVAATVTTAKLPPKFEVGYAVYSGKDTEDPGVIISVQKDGTYGVSFRSLDWSTVILPERDLHEWSQPKRAGRPKKAEVGGHIYAPQTGKIYIIDNICGRGTEDERYAVPGEFARFYKKDVVIL